MNFGQALEEIKAMGRVQRQGWNGKGMFICLQSFSAHYPLQPCISIYTSDKKLQPGWVPSQADMLAEDWVAYE